MTNEQQALAEMPIWLVILLALVGGVSGEMWRADKDGARGWALLRRLALRSGACIACGVTAMMLMIAAGMSIWTAGALGCLTAMAGADVAIGLYERWVAKRLGVTEASSNAGQGVGEGDFLGPPWPAPYTGYRTRGFPAAEFLAGMSVFSRG